MLDTANSQQLSPHFPTVSRSVTAALWLAVFLCLNIVASSEESGESYPLLISVRTNQMPAKLMGVGDDETLQFQRGQDTTEMKLSSIVVWGRHRDYWSPIRVFLSDGGSINANEIDFSTDFVSVESKSLGSMNLGRTQIRAIIFGPPADAFERDELEARCLQRQLTNDQIWLLNGDVITGQLVSVTKDKETSDWSVNFRLNEGRQTLPIPLQRVQTVAFRSPTGKAPTSASKELVCGFRDGSALRIASHEHGSEKIRLTAVGSVEHVMRVDDFVRQVCFFQPLGQSVVYLSDLKPTGYRHIPFFARQQPFCADGCVAGGRLRCDQNVAFKGLGMTSTSRLTYALERSFRSFAASIGLDDRAGEQGSVVFRVFVVRGAPSDREEIWQPAYESPKMRGGEPPIDIEIPLENVSHLSLVVEFADQGDACDYGNWLNARLLP